MPEQPLQAPALPEPAVQDTALQEPVVQEPVVQDQGGQGETAQPGESERQLTEAVADVTEITPEARAAAPEQTGIKDSRWILAQDPQSYTLQLVTVSTLERAEALVKRQPDPNEFAIYQVSRDNRLLHVVIYGLFSNASAAERAAEGFTGELATLKPWVRPLQLVQDAVHTTQG